MNNQNRIESIVRKKKRSSLDFSGVQRSAFACPRFSSVKRGNVESVLFPFSLSFLDLAPLNQWIPVRIKQARHLKRT